VRWIEGKRVRVAEDKADAFRFADWLIRRDHEEKVILIETKARWHRDAASEKQIALLARLRSGQPISTDLTKVQAKAMIDAMFQQFQFCVVIRYKRALAMSMILDWQALREACCAFPRLQK
jgi:hypothetical protein